MFYYLNSGWDRYVGQDYRAASRRNPQARIWAVLFYEETMPKPIVEALSDYRTVETVEVPRARAVLYVPKN
jgi:hypothetical protein